MVIWDVLPCIRAAIAEELVKRDCHKRRFQGFLELRLLRCPNMYQRREATTSYLGRRSKHLYPNWQMISWIKRSAILWNESVRFAGRFEKTRKDADQTIRNASKSIILIFP